MGRFSDKIDDIKNQTDELRKSITNALGADSYGLSIKGCADIIATRISDTSDLTSTTATENDVKLGKTFFSQSNEIKTGTFDTSYYENVGNKILSFVSGQVPMEIEIPTTITKIKKNAFYTDTATGDIANLFYKENLTIPDNITEIGYAAFRQCYITGTLTIPANCTHIQGHAFNSATMPEVVLYNGFHSNATYIFSLCKQIKKVVLKDPVGAIPNFTFNECTALTDVIFPETPSELAPSAFKNCYNMKRFTFVGPNPYILASNSLTSYKTVALLVPYEYYDIYDNASNYHAHGNPMFGYGEFEQGTTLPTGIDGYTFVWYQSYDDAKSQTNPVTSCDTSGTYYAIATEIV